MLISCQYVPSLGRAACIVCFCHYCNVVVSCQDVCNVTSKNVPSLGRVACIVFYKTLRGQGKRDSVFNCSIVIHELEVVSHSSSM